MAMNKKEQEYVESLETMLALRVTNKVLEDVPAPSFGEAYVSSFTFIVDSSLWARPMHLLSSNNGHDTSHDEPPNRTRSQGSRSGYSTKILALKAARNAIERRAATALRHVDLMIAKEEAGQ